MKNIFLIILSVALFSCATNTEKKIVPRGFQQITYQLDSLTDKNIVKELKLVADVTLDSDGEIESAIQTSYSFENMEGIAADVKEIYQPDITFSVNGPTMAELEIAFEQIFMDTLLVDGDKKFQYNKKSQLIFFSMYGGYFQMQLVYDEDGQWIKITKRSIDERRDVSTYEITERKMRYNEQPVSSMKPYYLIMNGEDLFEKKKKSIVDYFVLLKKSGIIKQDVAGRFDVPNGFFEYEDEGTGAGLYTSQIALFKTSDNRDILATNWYSGEAVAYWQMHGNRPKFYLFHNNVFSESPSIFPEVDVQMFFEEDYAGSTKGIQSYFILPQKGLSIQFLVNTQTGTFCNSLDSSHGNYQFYKKVCETYSKLKRTSIEIAFDKASGTFKLKL